MARNYEIFGELKDPVTVEQARTHLRVIARSDDEYIERLIRAGREAAEAFMGRAICVQNVREYFDAWPCDRIFNLSVPQLISLETFTYIDENGAETEIDTDNFYVDKVSFPGRIKLKRAYSWPVLNCDALNPIIIEYKAGWDETTDDKFEIPALVKQGILEHTADMYVNRTPVNIARDGRIAIQIPGPIQRLYGPYRVRA